MNNEYEIKGTSLILATTLTFLLLVTIATGAWLYYRNDQFAAPCLEGVAKSIMIEQLTGVVFSPDVAKWATISFGGTSVSIDTEKINIWLGENWETKRK